MEKEFSSIQNRQDLVQLPMVDTLVPHQEQQENVTSETHLNQPVIIREDPSKYDETEDGKKDSLDGEKKGGRRKINIEFIENKSRRHVTFSKRKAGI